MGMKPLGQAQYSSMATARSLATMYGATVPASADFCYIQCETQDCRWRDDGVDPTAAIGQILAAKDTIVLRRAQFANFRMIETAASAKVNISFYKTG